MTEQENRILFALIEPKKCWHDKWDWRPNDFGNKPYVCVKCKHREFEVPQRPDFTLPEWRIRLQEWIVHKDNKEFAYHFFQYTTDEYFEDVTCRHEIYGVMLLGGLVQFVLDFLRTPEAKERFGWVECHGCDGKDDVPTECSEGNKECIGTGKICAPWLVAMKEEVKDES